MDECNYINGAKNSKLIPVGLLEVLSYALEMKENIKNALWFKKKIIISVFKI